MIPLQNFLPKAPHSAEKKRRRGGITKKAMVKSIALLQNSGK